MDTDPHLEERVNQEIQENHKVQPRMEGGRALLLDGLDAAELLTIFILIWDGLLGILEVNPGAFN